MDKKEIILEKFRELLAQNPNSKLISLPLKTWKKEIDNDLDKSLFNEFNKLSEEGILNIRENKSNYLLTMLDLTEKGKQLL